MPEARNTIKIQLLNVENLACDKKKGNKVKKYTI